MQNKMKFPICQIVGYKNSGKTTVMTKLIRYFTNQGVQVGTFKHHGHGGEPDIIKNTDSSKQFEAGSIVSAVLGEKQFHLTAKDISHYTLDEVLQFYTFFPIDILLIEGYKKADYPKIVLINSDEDLHLLKDLTNIIAVGSWHAELIESLDCFTFSLEKIDAALPQLANYITLESNRHNG